MRWQRAIAAQDEERCQRGDVAEQRGDFPLQRPVQGAILGRESLHPNDVFCLLLVAATFIETAQVARVSQQHGLILDILMMP
jgi:hypothetical protein